MNAFKTRLKSTDDDFRAAAAQMRAQVDELNQKLARVRQGGDTASRERHTAR